MRPLPARRVEPPAGRVAPPPGRRARALRWAVGLALLGVVVSWLDVGSIGARLAAVDRPPAVVGVLGLVALHLIGALTWQRLTARLAGVRVPPAAAVRLFYAGQAFGAVTPANLGSDAYRVAALDRRGSRGLIALPIVVQRLTSVAAIVVLGALGALALPIPGLGWFGALVLAAVAISAFVAVAAWRTGAVRPGRAPLTRVARRFGLDGPELSGARARSSALRDGFGLGILFHGLALLLGLLLVAAVDPSAVARPVVVVAALAVARLSLALPLSPSGIGIQEGVLAVLFAQLGLAPETAVAATLLNRVALIVTSLIGSVAILGEAGVAAVGTDRSRAPGPGPSDQPAGGPTTPSGSAAASGISVARTIAASSALDAPERARRVSPRPRVSS